MRRTQATIVVQQPSLSEGTPATVLIPQDTDNRRKEDMKQLQQEVVNSLTLQEYRDIEMRQENFDFQICVLKTYKFITKSKNEHYQIF